MDNARSPAGLASPAHGGDGIPSQRARTEPRNDPRGMDPYGKSAAVLAEACGVDISTTRKWKRAKRIPTQHHQWLKFYFGHDLGAFAKGWDGWRMHDGELWSPEDVSYTPGAIRAGPYDRDLARQLQGDLAKLIDTAESDQDRRERLQHLETMQEALYTALEAFKTLTSRLTPREQEKLFQAHPTTRNLRARSAA